MRSRAVCENLRKHATSLDCKKWTMRQPRARASPHECSVARLWSQPQLNEGRLMWMVIGCPLKHNLSLKTLTLLSLLTGPLAQSYVKHGALQPRPGRDNISPKPSEVFPQSSSSTLQRRPASMLQFSAHPRKYPFMPQVSRASTSSFPAFSERN